mmetsp:Transcript_1838/g.3502  ORF Transcript_1838/g.3502 Transcript_1838/m.3502 type:complete len:397 (+) Transcript_1838:79-1269(+)|eukprot:CAMPEP_0201887588 /NCGR_PEP_ID=MMETSP0902-20130614/25287_1 /ASSEMBLY_ACC=CAM_ASM_000551 /TAXON_ID=420261 /ORGANISM="Thalassiosira antarctica, Strain CCMP982" /LENGTH=396 /DNA_ID=CAMNT_0048417561 /DNA_START=75 /DNA_END=1265 /DNA_ORIENTATION=+
MASSNGNDWCTIESDPGVFTSLIESFGTKNVEFAELWSLDDDSLLQLIRPMEGVDNAAVHGLIFLFKWQSSSHSSKEEDTSKEDEGDGSRGKPLVGEDCPPGLFFAKQVTHNACATQAILSVLFNAPNSIVEQEGEGDDEKAEEKDDDNGRRLVLGKTLSNFKSFTSHFPPDLRGEAIGSSDEIRTAHNSFGRAEDAFLSDPSKPKRSATDDDDVFHFIAYVPNEEDGCVYELDGLQAGPIRVGSYKKEDGDEIANDGNNENTDTTSMDWIRVARNAIQNRLANYSPTEIKFNLMAMVQDKRTYLTERLNALAAIPMEESDPAVLSIRSELHAEEEKRAQWTAENERRRYNYLPFCVELLRCLAGSGKFDGLVDKARESVGEKRKRAEAWKAESSK